MKELNEVYKKKLMYYWCNCTGDINVPGSGLGYCGTVEDLPFAIRRLYTEYWGEGRGMNEYCVSYAGRPGLALTTLFDYSWLEDMGFGCNDVAKAALHAAVKEQAEQLEAEYAACNSKFEVLYGMDTDPDGDEILIFIPAEDLFSTKPGYHWVNGENNIYGLSTRLYDGVESKIKAALAVPGDSMSEDERVEKLLSILADAIASAETIRDKEDSIWEEDKQIVRHEMDDLVDLLIGAKSYIAK